MSSSRFKGIATVIPLLLLTQSYAAAQPGMQPTLINVPFLPQVPPGNWEQTKNCGVACALMVQGYFKHMPVSATSIKKADVWLANRLHDSRYLDDNGWFTNFTGNDSLGILLREYCGLSCAPQSGAGIGSVINQVSQGHPVLAEVHIDTNTHRIAAHGNDPHWVIVIGFDPRSQSLIVNDPGTNAGHMYRCPLSTFTQSWALEGNVCAVVHP